MAFAMATATATATSMSMSNITAACPPSPSLMAPTISTSVVSKKNPSIRMRMSGISRCLVIETETETETDTLQSQSQSLTRRLILLRHAKSSWEYPSLRDHDRPLSKTGQADAVRVSEKLQQLGWIPQLILSRQTLKIMQEHVQGFLEAEVHFISSFYSVAAMDGQTAHHLQQAICRYSRDEVLTVMCMGHNRGWEEAASMFTGASVELKTCNAALLEATGKSWEEAFATAGLGGWKLQGIVTPSSSL